MLRELLSRVASAVFAVAAIQTNAVAQPAEGPARPNIVFFIADDLGYRDLGAFGQEKIKTPNIDRLAAEGIRLTTHYSGNAVCAPSRCVLLSGYHPGHAAVRDNSKLETYALGENEGQVPVPPGHLRLPLTLKSLGYTTGAFGKWGLGAVATTGNPQLQGIDRFYGYICQSVAHNYYPKYLWDDGKQVELRNPEPSRQPRLAEGADPASPASYEAFKGTDYAPDLIGEQALKFVDANKDRPFFLYYPTIVPHLGYQVPDDSLKEYEGKFPEEPYAGASDYVPQRTPRAAYAAMITRLDREVGRVVKRVQELGLDERTIFVFVSDNGAPPGIPTSYFNSGGVFRGSKGTIYEGGLRVPAIVRWKGRIAAGTSSDRVTGFEDWLPTLLELAGGASAAPKDLDGVSFAPTLLGKRQEPRAFLYREFPSRGGGQFVRVGDWKLIRQTNGRLAAATQAGERGGERTGEQRARRSPGAPDPAAVAGAGEFELYDLGSDPSEQRNVAAEHPDVVERLAKYFESEHQRSERFPLAVLNEK